MKWAIILGVVGIVILVLSLVASRRYLLRALGWSEKRAKRPTETEEELAVNRLIRKFRGLREQLPTEYRFSGDAKDLAAVQSSVRSLESLQAEVKAQHSRSAAPAAVESLDRLLVAIPDALSPLKETEIVNRHMQRLQRVARALSESESGAQVKGREAIAVPVDVLRSLQREMELDRQSFRDSQTKNAMDRLIGQVQGFLAGVEERQPREMASSEREELRPKVEESAARMASAPAGAAFLGGQEENLIDFAEFVLQRYAWALDPSQVSLFTSLVEEGRRVLYDLDGAGLAYEIAAVRQRTYNLSEILQVFLEVLLALRGVIALRVQAAEPNLAAELSAQLDAVEAACGAGDPSWEGNVTALAQEVQQAVQRIESKMLPCSKPAPAASSPIAIAPHERQGNAEMPVALTDRVHFSVAAPAMVAPGTAFIVDVWAHLEHQRAEVIQRIHESVKLGRIIAEKGPIRIARGTILTVRLRAEDLIVEDAEDTILWEGEIGKASLPVKVPAKAAEGEKSATMTFHVDGLQVAKLHFTLTVGRACTAAKTLPARQTCYRTAFASYASKDRDEVLNIIQGIQKGVPSLDIFLDVAKLRSGEKWETRLRTEICARDVFYLFWSEAARQSPWVEREWRCAYEYRGVDFIDPVPLVSPEMVPPPRELAELHFNDWVLAYRRRAQPAAN